MDNRKVMIYGMFAGMDIITTKGDNMNDARVEYLTNLVLKELGMETIKGKDFIKLHNFLSRVNTLCGDIMLK